MSRTTDTTWGLGKSRPWPPPPPPPARRHRESSAKPEPAAQASSGAGIVLSPSKSKGTTSKGKGSKGKVTGKPGKGHPCAPKRARKRDKQTGKCVRSKKRSVAVQQNRNLRKRLHQVKQQIRQDAQASNDSVHSECEVEELGSPSTEPSAEESAQPASSDESSLSV